MNPYDVIMTHLLIETIPVDDENGLPPIEFVHGGVLMATVQGRETLYLAAVLVDCSRREGRWVAAEWKSLLKGIMVRIQLSAEGDRYSHIFGWRLKLAGWLLASFGWNRLPDYVVRKAFFRSLRRLKKDGQIKTRKLEDGTVYIQPTPKLVKITPLDKATRSTRERGQHWL